MAFSRVQHAAPVAILPRVRVLGERRGGVLLIAVAERDDLRTRRNRVPDIVCAAPSGTHDGERHPIRGLKAARREAGAGQHLAP